MNFIDITYFVNEINIPVDDYNPGTLDAAIIRYQKEILKSLLGYQLWKELMADLDSLGNPQTQKFTDLVDGAEFSFEYGGETINTKWEGLRNDDMVSLISYYVYYKYRKDFDTNYSGNSQTMPINENSQVIPYGYKLSTIWNLMIELYGKTPTKYDDNYIFPYNPYFSDSIYTNSKTWDQKYFFLNLDNYVHFNDTPSAYNFLLANKTDYTNWIFNPLYEQNSFGI